MSEHQATIRWKRETPDFEYNSYNRSHSWEFEGGVVTPASAAPGYQGDPDRSPTRRSERSIGSGWLAESPPEATSRTLLDRSIDRRRSGIPSKPYSDRAGAARYTRPSSLPGQHWRSCSSAHRLANDRTLPRRNRRTVRHGRADWRKSTGSNRRHRRQGCARLGLPQICPPRALLLQQPRRQRPTSIGLTSQLGGRSSSAFSSSYWGEMDAHTVAARIEAIHQVLIIDY